jgi:hypothetical protein
MPGRPILLGQGWVVLATRVPPRPRHGPGRSTTPINARLTTQPSLWGRCHRRSVFLSESRQDSEEDHRLHR